MTDHQVTILAAISTALPTLAILVAMVSNNRQIDSLNRQMESLRREITTRIDGLQALMSARFNSARFNSARFDAVDVKFTAAHQGLLRVEGVLDARLRHLEDS